MTPEIASPPTDAQVPAPLAGRTILVVEDDPQVMRALCRLLRSSGAVLFRATSGSEALALHLDALDLLLTDGDLGDMHAIELIPLLMQRPSLAAARVLVYTGDRDPSISQRLFLAGADNVLFKPAPANQLRSVVQRMVLGQ